MKQILIIMMSVLILDFVIAASFFDFSWRISGLSLLMFITSFALFRPRKRKATKAEGWILGEAQELSDPNHPVKVKKALISQKVLNFGVLGIGAQGTGKTESVILGQLKAVKGYSPNSGFALFDGKGDIDTYKKFVAMGERPDFFFSSELPGSDSINILSGENSDVIDRLTTLLIGETSTTSFYADDQRAVLSRIVPLLLNLKIPVNLRDLYVVLTVDEAGEDLLRLSRRLELDPSLIQFAETWFNQPSKTRLKNISGLLNRLMIFITGPNADRLNCYKPDISIHDIVEKGKTFYAHLPLTEFSKDVAVAIINMFEVEARKRQLAGNEGVHVFPLFFDDWSGFFHAGFAPFSARCRSAAMPLSFGFQSRAHLDAVSHTYLDALDDTITTKIIMRIQGSGTANYVRKLLCEYETPEISQSDSSVKGETMFIIKQDRIDPRALRELNPGEAFVSTLVSEGGKTKNPLWRVQLARPDFKDWEKTSLPPPRTHQDGEGLNFWKKYMGHEDAGVLQALISEITEAQSKTPIENQREVKC